MNLNLNSNPNSTPRLPAGEVNGLVNYLHIPEMVRRQREFLYAKIAQVSQAHVVYPGLGCFRKPL